MFIVISYDIRDNRRRAKVSALIEDFGGQRVQLSVFECHLESEHLARLQQDLETLIDEEEDSIRFYRLCQMCQQNVVYLGVAQATDEPGLRII